MKERPILFSSPMVRAILEGRKTQTRRVIKPQPKWTRPMTPSIMKPGEFYLSGTMGIIRCPYGQPGDRLWVRETFNDDNLQTVYRADYTASVLAVAEYKWKPSIYMPRWASRITLEITDIRVQRVQRISHEDSLAEGINAEDNNYGTGSKYRDTFAELWDSINAKRGFGWNVNPWVWAVTFRRTS